jgi:hypothetical protein
LPDNVTFNIIRERTGGREGRAGEGGREAGGRWDAWKQRKKEIKNESTTGKHKDTHARAYIHTHTHTHTHIPHKRGASGTVEG